jgi:hypothetical protein
MKLAALWLAALFACGDGDAKVIGDPCSSGNLCGVNPRAACITAWPDGYCTEIDCALGSCPIGARCVTRVSFPNVPFDAFCLETCTGAGDCRDGYRCVDISSMEKVCAPALP